METLEAAARQGELRPGRVGGYDAKIKTGYRNLLRYGYLLRKRDFMVGCSIARRVEGRGGSLEESGQVVAERICERL